MSEHPYIDTSHIPSYVSDRGPSKYFHGRTEILNNFKNLAEESVEEKTGSIFLIQGAPGAGKTALLDEIASDAIENQWDVIEINYDDLHNPAQMAQTLGKPYVSRKQTAVKGDMKLFGGQRLKEVAGDSNVPRVLEKMKPKRGVLLILDEAQYVGRFCNTSNESAVASTLNSLHNGKLPHPVILLAAGLGPSKAAFGDLGISRFRGGCFVELGALSKESERAVIRDWLIKDGRAKGDPTVWVDVIAQQTHGWPQHITAYGDAAAKQIRHDEGVMTSAGLEVVYQAGLKKRKAYYEQRVVGFDGDELSCLYGAIAEVESGTLFNKGLIFDPLEKKYGSEEAKKVFKKFIDKGIVSLVGGLYSVPIPSMHDWMKSELERIQEALRQAKVAQNKGADSKSIGPARDMSSFTPMEPRERTILKPPVQSKEKGNPQEDRGSSPEMER